MHHTRQRTLSALAGQIIGHRKDGRPIRLIAGGSGEGDDTGATDDTGDGSGDDQADKDGPDGSGTKKPKIDGDVDKERVARTLAAARDGEKKAKADAKAAKDRLDAVLKAAGLTPDGKTDPAEQLKEVAGERDTLRSENGELRAENVVLRHAGKAGGDVDALLDSTTFRRNLAELDHTASDFKDQVLAAIKDAVKANPKLAATPAGPPARRGADHSGGGGDKGGRPKSLREAFARKNNT